MIIRITFKAPNGEPFTMLFGNSYKKWKTQVAEYVNLYSPKSKPLEAISAQVSTARWKSWGGLKWCAEENFQHELNREGVQDYEPDNPKARYYKAMYFEDYPGGLAAVRSLLIAKSKQYQ